MSPLSIAFTAMPFIVAMFAGLLVPLALFMCYRSFGFGVFAAGLVMMWEVWFYDLGGIQLGISMYPSDLAALMFAAVAAARALVVKDAPRIHRAWLIFVTIFFISLLGGLATTGTAAGVQGRTYFHAVALCSYAMTFSIDAQRMHQFIIGIIWVARLLMLTTLYRWVVYYTPITPLLPPDGSYNIDGAIRVVWSNGAIVMAQFAVLAAMEFFGLALMTPANRRASLGIIGSAVVILQHRSVWLAAIAGAAVAKFIDRMAGARASGARILVIVSLAFVAVAAVTLSKNVSVLTSGVAASAGRALEGRGTVFERWNSWQSILEKWRQGGVKAILIGQSFGTDMSRFVVTDKAETRKIEYQAHNHYIQSLFYLGILGLGTYLYLYGWTIKRLYRMCRGRPMDPAAAVLLTLLVMQLVYDVAYSSNLFQHFMLGVAFAYVMGREQATAVASRWPSSHVKGVLYR